MKGTTKTGITLPVLALLSALALASCAHFHSTPSDEAPGTSLWAYQTAAELWAPLTLHEGILLFGSDDGTVTALDVASQRVRWSAITGGRVRSTVAVVGESAYFASDDGYLYAVGLADGQRRWRFDLGSREMQRMLPSLDPPYDYDYLMSSPTVAAGVLYVGSADGHLYAIDTDSGQQRWRFKTGGKIRSTPIVAQNRVHFGSWDGHVYALDAGTGSQLWRFDTGSIIQGSPAMAGGNVIIGSRSARIFALDAATGSVAWTYVFTDGSLVESSPVLDGSTLYIGTSDALKLVALDVNSGDLKWHFETGGWSWGAPVVAKGTVYIGGISASPYYFEGVDLIRGLYAVDAATGLERWRMQPAVMSGYVTGGVFASVAVDDDVIYAASIDGMIHALRR